jgi:hypothetical protein
MQPHTGTNLNLGLEAAYGIQTARDAAEVHGRNRRVVLVTDALLNEGQLDQGLVAQVGTNLEAHDIRLSGIGVGREFNDKMLDKLTENGKGAYVYLGSEAVVDRVFGPMFDALVRTVAHDVHFSIDLPPSLAMERFYGEESSTNREDVKPVHYYAGTTQLFLQDLHVSPQGAVREDPITMRIEFRDAVTDEPMIQELRTTVGALLDADPHNVQKGQALMAFADWTLAGAMQRRPLRRAARRLPPPRRFARRRRRDRVRQRPRGVALPGADERRRRSRGPAQAQDRRRPAHLERLAGVRRPDPPGARCVPGTTWPASTRSSPARVRSSWTGRCRWRPRWRCRPPAVTCAAPSAAGAMICS